MSKAEFLEQLRLSLNGRIDADQVMDNLRYYEDYINSQLRLGKTEEDIMSMLGSPRLIARTITDANSDGAQGYAEYTQDTQGFGQGGRFTQSAQAYEREAQGWDGDGYADQNPNQEAWDRIAQGPFGQAFFNRTRQEVTNSDKNRFGKSNLLVKFFMLPEGLRKLIGVAIGIALIILFFWILKFLVPILLVGGLALFLVKLFKDWLK